MTREELAKKNKIQLWITICELNLVGNDCSLYNMSGLTKKDMIDMILEKENTK